MRTRNLLLEIIALVDDFEKVLPEEEEPTMHSFIDFLVKQPSENNDERVIIDISKNVSLLHRYSKFYLKKILRDSRLQTIDEYSYLICLFYNESLTKTELNNMNAMEKTSGNEVIKRLLKSHLLKQQRDINDKRSMRVSITEQGKTELEKIFPELQKTAKILSGNISDYEKFSLNKYLTALCEYHHTNFTELKNSEIDTYYKVLTDSDK